MAVVYETVDGEGLRSYIAKLYRLPEEKPYSMLARGPRWTHRDIAVLVRYRDDLDKAARLLGRTREACKKQLQRLGLSLGGTIEKKFWCIRERALVNVSISNELGGLKSVCQGLLLIIRTKTILHARAQSPFFRQTNVLSISTPSMTGRCKNLVTFPKSCYIFAY